MNIFKNFKRMTRLLSVSLIALLAVGCADLAVDNENSPTTEQVLASPSDLESLISSSYVTWWQATTDEMLLGVRVGADVYTTTVGNFDMLNRGVEPRIPYDNSPTASDDKKLLTERIWYGMYGVLSDANDFLTQLDEQDVVIPSRVEEVSDEDYTAMIRANAIFQQGLTFMELGLYYDQAFVFDEATENIDDVELVPYGEVLEAAYQKFEDAKEIASGLSGVTLGDGYISGYNNMSMDVGFVQLIETLQARTLVLGARTPEETNNVDWELVKQHASNGIESDFSPEGDNNFWYDYTKMYANAGWVRVDQRIVHLLDPSQPERYPTSEGEFLGEASSDDARLESDFTHNGSFSIFTASRGKYLFSEYQMLNGRYGYHTFADASGDMPRYLKAENDLMYAEAVARTNDAANYQTAAELVNNTRVDRGELDAISATDFGTGDAMDAILYEREIELLHTGFMQGLGDQRRLGNLQEGSIEHYPLPAEELGILQMELYTFGGVENSDQNGTAKQKENPFETKFPVEPFYNADVADKQ